MNLITYADKVTGVSQFTAGDANEIKRVVNTNAIVSVPTLTPSSTGSASENTMALQAAIDALPSNGGTIHFNPGVYYFSGTISVDKPVAFKSSVAGAVSPNVGYLTNRDISGCRLVQLADATPLFTIAKDASVFYNLRMSCGYNGNPSAGSTAVTTTSNASTAVKMKYCMVDGWYIGVDKRHGRYWVLDDNDFYNNTYAGVRIDNLDTPDEGDDIIVNNRFLGGSKVQFDGVTAGRAEPYAGLVWRNSGGLRVVNNKFNQGFLNTSSQNTYFKHFVDMKPSGPTTTGQIYLQLNSFDNCRSHPLILDMTVADLSEMFIQGNFFGPNHLEKVSDIFLFYMEGTGTTGMYFLDRLDISGNSCNGSAALARLENLRTGTISNSRTKRPALGTANVAIGRNVQGAVNIDIPVIQQLFKVNTGAGDRFPPIPMYESIVEQKSVVYYDRPLEQYRGRVDSFGSSNITGVSGIGTSTLTITLATNYYKVGQRVYLAGLPTITGAVNNNYVTVVTSTGTTGGNITVSIPAGTGGTWSSGGYVADAGVFYELILYQNSGINLKLENAFGYPSASIPGISEILQRSIVYDGTNFTISKLGDDSVAGAAYYPTPGSTPNANMLEVSDRFIATGLISNPVFTNGTVSLATTSVTGKTVSLASTTGVANGQAVYGPGILPGTLVASFVADTSITLNQPAIGSTGETLIFATGAGVGHEVVFEGIPGVGNLPGVWSSSGVVVTQQTTSEAGASEKNLTVGDYVSGNSYTVSGISGVGTSTCVITLTTTPQFSVGELVQIYSLTGLTLDRRMYICKAIAGNTATIDGRYITGTYTSGGTLKDVKKVVDVLNSMNFTTDSAFKPALSSVALNSNYGGTLGGIIAGKLRVIVRPIGTNAAVKEFVRSKLSIQGVVKAIVVIPEQA